MGNPFFEPRVPAAGKMLYPALEGPEAEYWSLHDYSRAVTADFAKAKGVDISFWGFRGESFDRRHVVVYCFIPSADVDVLLQNGSMMEFPYGRGGSREYLRKSPIARRMPAGWNDEYARDDGKNLIEVTLHVPLPLTIPQEIERLLNINRSLVMAELGSAVLTN